MTRYGSDNHAGLSGAPGGCNIGFGSQAAKFYQQVLHGTFVLSFVSLSFPARA